MENIKTRIVITGVTSIHGWPIFENLRNNQNFMVLGIRSPKMKIPSGQDTKGLCITDKSAFENIREKFDPQIVIHAAGVCDLDVCEERPLWAESINTTGAQVIADVFGKKSYVVYLSSDLVFSGNKPFDGGYIEECTPDPISIAGKTMEMAERNITTCRKWCIIRLGLPIGKSVTGDKGAVDFIDYRLRRSLPLTLFHDELRSCISCYDICNIINCIISNQYQGLYHLGGPESFSLYDIGEWVRKKNNYRSGLLKGISRFDEKNGPPRIGNVSLCSEKILSLVNIKIPVPLD